MKDNEMRHWLDLTDAERDAMSEDEKNACIKKSLQRDMAIEELVQAGLWVRSSYQTIFKLPNCHDFGYEQ